MVIPTIIIITKVASFSCEPLELQLISSSPYDKGSYGFIIWIFPNNDHQKLLGDYRFKMINFEFF